LRGWCMLLCCVFGLGDWVGGVCCVEGGVSAQSIVWAGEGAKRGGRKGGSIDLGLARMHGWIYARGILFLVQFSVVLGADDREIITTTRPCSHLQRDLDLRSQRIARRDALEQPTLHPMPPPPRPIAAAPAAAHTRERADGAELPAQGAACPAASRLVGLWGEGAAGGGGGGGCRGRFVLPVLFFWGGGGGEGGMLG
jgi:hypothetical protein